MRLFIASLCLLAAHALSAAGFQSIDFGFQPNRGQSRPGVLFSAEGAGQSLLFTASGVETLLPGGTSVTMRLHGASPLSPTGEDSLPGLIHHLNGPSNIPRFASLRSKNVYPGIDLVYTRDGDRFAYDFHLAPFASPSSIRLHFDSPSSPRLDPQGNLVLPTPAGDLLQHRPVAYQSRHGRRIPVPASFQLHANEVSFQLGDYDPSLPLVIDPPISYLSYFGGSPSSRAEGLFTDGSGAAYLIGMTAPAVSGVTPTTLTGGGSFVAKFNAAGQLVYYTRTNIPNAAARVDSQGFVYLSGYEVNSPNDHVVIKLNQAGNALVYRRVLNIVNRTEVLAVDASGNAYLAGRFQGSESKFTATAGAFRTTASGSGGFLLKIDPTGANDVYRTYLPNASRFANLEVDSAGAVYFNLIIPSAWGTPTVLGLPDRNSTGFAKLNPAGSALSYLVDFSADGFSFDNFTLDSQGSFILVGRYFLSGDVTIPLVKPLDNTNSGFDVYVAKFNPAATAISWSTLLGGSAGEFNNPGTVDTDGQDNVWIGGITLSTDFPLSSPTQNARSGNIDAFLTQINSAGTAILFSTYAGTSAGEQFGGNFAAYVSADSGSAYLAFNAPSSTLPAVNAFQGTYPGGTQSAVIGKWGTTTVPCSFTLGAPAVAAPAGGLNGSVTVTTASGCNVTATPSDSWITITAGAPASASTTVTFSVAPNSGAARNGSISISGVLFTISQGAPQANSVPAVSSLSPISATGTSTTRTFVFSDADGAANIAVVNVLVNFYLDGRSACYLAYDSIGNVMYLVQDDGGTLQGLALPSAGTLANSQCSIPANSISAVKSGNTLTLTLTMNFLGSFGGTRVVFAAARDLSGGNSGWSPAGQHTISTPASNPTPLSASPASGTATASVSYPVSVAYRDATSSLNLQPVQILINDAVDGRNACYVGFDHAGNVLYLVDDLGGSLLPTAIRLNGAAGGSASVENAQCRIVASGSTFTDSGQTLTLTLQIQFKTPFAGRRLIYAGTQTTAGANSGWSVVGAVTVQ